MHRIITCSLVIALCPTLAATQDVELLEQEALYEAALRVAPSVVRIETFGGLDKVGQTLVSAGPTSGVVVREDGYVVSSAYNFINQPSSILVQLANGSRKAAKIVSRDRSRHLVLLKVDVDEPLQMPTVFPKKDVQVGQWAITVGRTLPGDGPNMTVGIISAKQRIWGRAIQTDANVSPANYGGALVDVSGRIIGVLVPLSPTANEVHAGAEWYDSGIGFAIPYEDIMTSLERLMEGDLYSGKLGIALKGSDEYGVEPVVAVSRPKSPARAAGMIAGDKVLAINEHPVRRQVELRHRLGPLYAGDSVKISFQRGDERFDREIELVDKLLAYEHAFLGILPVRDANAAETGVLVRYVFPGSPADELGLQAGDAITKIAENVVNDAETLRTHLAALEPGASVSLTWRRAQETSGHIVELQRLPELFPASLPPKYPDLKVADEDLPPLGKINIKLPEEAGDCQAYIPQQYDPRVAHSLLVVLPVPGTETIDDVLQGWRSLCDTERVLLLVPGAKESRAWLPTEATFIRKTIDNLKNDYNVASERIVIHGKNNSGAMALLTALTHRDLVRGVSAVDAPVPSRAPTVFNEPMQRLAVVFTMSQKGPITSRIESHVKRLREAKIPVISQTLGKGVELDREKLLRWVDSLDRI